MVEEDIQLGIMQATPGKVMMARVSKVDGDKLVLGAEVLEKSEPVSIFGVAIRITSNVYWAGMGGSNFFNEHLKERESGHKFWISARSGEI